MVIYRLQTLPYSFLDDWLTVTLTEDIPIVILGILKYT